MSEGNMLPAEFYSRVNRSRANSYSELLEKILTEPGLHLHYLGLQTKEILSSDNEYADMLDTFFLPQAKKYYHE